MGSTGQPAVDPAAVVEGVVVRRVVEHAAEWFPGVDASRMGARLLSDRPRSRLYAVTLGADDAPCVIAKVRRATPTTETGRGSRPRLSTHPLTVSELTALEFGGLRSISAIFAASGPSFGAVRALDHLVAEHTILMDYVNATTLRELRVRRSRMRPSYWIDRRGDLGTAWQRAGAWLRVFQQRMPDHGTTPRQSTRSEVVDRFGAYGDFLGFYLGTREIGRVAAQGAQLAADVLPERLPMAVGHGDFAPRNVVLGAEGRLTVLDPMPRWQVPSYEDLCRFLIGVRLLGLQLHSHGIAYGRDDVERCERDVLRGYYAGGDVPPAVRCYQLLILLDKWSALVDDSGRGWGQRVRGASITLADGFLHRQARRLLELASAGDV